MVSNQLHINLTKSLCMHFQPYLNHCKRQTCARTRTEKRLTLENLKLKTVKKLKFLGVMIDDKLTWKAKFIIQKKNFYLVL